MEEEVWKSVNHDLLRDCFEVSNMGNLRRIAYKYPDVSKPKKLPFYPKIIDDKDGYKIAKILIDKKCHTFYMHRLVALTFIENVNNYAQINHKNGIKWDNRVENLEWCTCSQNNYHRYKEIFSVKIDHRVSKPIIKYDKDMNVVDEYYCIQDVVIRDKRSDKCINKYCKNKQMDKRGFYWRYKE